MVSRELEAYARQSCPSFVPPELLEVIQSDMDYITIQRCFDAYVATFNMIQWPEGDYLTAREMRKTQVCTREELEELYVDYIDEVVLEMLDVTLTWTDKIPQLYRVVTRMIFHQVQKDMDEDLRFTIQQNPIGELCVHPGSIVCENAGFLKSWLDAHLVQLNIPLNCMLETHDAWYELQEDYWTEIWFTRMAIEEAMDEMEIAGEGDPFLA